MYLFQEYTCSNYVLQKGVRFCLQLKTIVFRSFLGTRQIFIIEDIIYINIYILEDANLAYLAILSYRIAWGGRTILKIGTTWELDLHFMWGNAYFVTNMLEYTYSSVQHFSSGGENRCGMKLGNEVRYFCSAISARIFVNFQDEGKFKIN